MYGKTAKIMSFSALVLLAVGLAAGFDSTQAETLYDEKPTKKFTGTLTTEARQVGDYLHVKYVYSSDELKHYNVDHIYRETITQIPANMSKETIREYTSELRIVENQKFDLIHEGDIDKLQAFQDENSDGIPTGSYQQWKIKGMENKPVTRVLYDSGITYTSSFPNWAAKQDGSVYREHDPVNLVWQDTVSSGGDLMGKIKSRMDSRGWNGLCPSGHLWLNVNGVWALPDEEFKYATSFFTPCDQYHIRAWTFNDDLVLGAAHDEDFEIIGAQLVDYHHMSNTGPDRWDRDVWEWGAFHVVKGFETAEDEAAGEFTGSCWRYSRDSMPLNNEYTRYTYVSDVLVGTAYNNGDATVITCS